MENIGNPKSVMERHIAEAIERVVASARSLVQEVEKKCSSFHDAHALGKVESALCLITL